MSKINTMNKIKSFYLYQSLLSQTQSLSLGQLKSVSVSIYDVHPVLNQFQVPRLINFYHQRSGKSLVLDHFTEPPFAIFVLLFLIVRLFLRGEIFTLFKRIFWRLVVNLVGALLKHPGLIFSKRCNFHWIFYCLFLNAFFHVLFLKPQRVYLSFKTLHLLQHDL